MRLLRFVTFPLVSCMVLVGCGETNTEARDSSGSETTQSSEDIQANQDNQTNLPADAPVLKVAIEKDAYPPFEFQDEYGKYIGYDFDLIKAIGEEAGFKVHMDPRPFSEVLASVEEGSNDLAISALTISEERLKKFSASEPYIKSFSSFVVKDDTDIQDLTHLIGKKVSTQKGGFQHSILEESGEYEIKAVKTNYLAFQTLFTDDVEALFADRNMLFFLEKEFPEHSIRFIPYGEQIELGIYTQKNNNEVLDKINDGLHKVKQSGKYQKLNEKWFGTHAQDVAVNN